MNNDERAYIEKMIADLVHQRDEARAECDALRKDAERYRWLKQNVTSHDFSNTNKFLSFEVRRWYHDSHVMTTNSLDATIDAAMKEKP